MQNYIVVYSIPNTVERKIKNVYQEIFNKTLPIKNLHLTLLPPFSLINKDTLKKLKTFTKNVKESKIEANIASPELFTNPGETILYLPVEPKKKIIKVFDKLNTFSKDLIKFETSLYHTDEVPPFLPHISLDYDFTFNSDTLIKLSEKLGKLNLILNKPIIMVKTSQESWKQISQ